MKPPRIVGHFSNEGGFYITEDGRTLETPAPFMLPKDWKAPLEFGDEATDDDLFTIQCAIENLRSPDKDEKRIEASWRIASKLEAMVKRIKERKQVMDQKQLQELLDFLNSIEGAGYGGMAAFEIARTNVRAALGLPPVHHVLQAQDLVVEKPGFDEPGPALT